MGEYFILEEFFAVLLDDLGDFGVVEAAVFDEDAGAVVVGGVGGRDDGHALYLVASAGRLRRVINAMPSGQRKSIKPRGSCDQACGRTGGQRVGGGKEDASRNDAANRAFGMTNY